MKYGAWFQVTGYRVFTFSIVFYSLFFILVADASAQFQSNVQTNYLNTNPDVPQNFRTYTQTVFIEIFSTITCAIAGYDLINPQAKCLGLDPKSGKIGYVENGTGLLGITSSMIAMTFEIPVSSTHYGIYLADNFALAKKTHATAGSDPTFQEEKQGSPQLEKTGFSSLRQLLPIWKVFRNTVYIFFVLIFVIIGLGIMFRIKIDPRTVMTIQNQIPKIIIALILVTFSYAIAGFLVDLMYVLTYLFYNLVASANLVDVTDFSPAKIQGSNPLQAVGPLGGLGLVGNTAFGLGGILSSLFDGTIGKAIVGLTVALIAGIIGGVTGGFGPLGWIFGGVLSSGVAIGSSIFGNDILGFIGAMIAFIVLAAAVLTALFRLWFQLIKAYVMILISVVLAPFWIAAGLIPGSGLNFGAWIRDVGANLAVFPTTLVMFLLGKIFIDAFGKGRADVFTPPLVGNPGNSDNFGALIGIGIVFLTPGVVNIVRQTIKAPAGKLSVEIGRSVGAGVGETTGTVKGIGGTISAYTQGSVPKPGVGAVLGRLFR